VITIDVARCTGCGACVDVCPTGALYLVDGKAVVDDALCRECEACLAACPCEAITLTTRQEAAPEPVRLPAIRPEPEVIRVTTSPTPLRSGTLAKPLPLRYRVLPVLGAALTWTGREIIPRLGELFLERLDRQAAAATRQARNVARPTSSGGRREGRGGGRRRRERRGGRSR